jgi:hypothetical protein
LSAGNTGQPPSEAPVVDVGGFGAFGMLVGGGLGCGAVLGSAPGDGTGAAAVADGEGLADGMPSGDGEGALVDGVGDAVAAAVGSTSPTARGMLEHAATRTANAENRRRRMTSTVTLVVAARPGRGA